MTHKPPLLQFAELAKNYRLVPVYRRLLADSLTPLSAFSRIDAGESGCLFESVIGGEKVGRYSFLGADPFLRFEAFGNSVQVTDSHGTKSSHSEDPLEDLRRLMDLFKPPHLSELPPFTSGAIGYASYDAIRYIEHLPNQPPDDRNLPDLSFSFYDRLVVFDNVTKTLDVVVLAHLDDASIPSDQAYKKACDRIDETVRMLSAPSAWPVPADIERTADVQCEIKSNFTKSVFVEKVKKAIDYIQAGDIFQVVLSQRLEVDFDLPPLELYRTLRVVNPSPFMFFLRTPSVTLVGSSPEIMVRVVGGTVTVRPLAGTRKRGATTEEDELLAQSLLADPKERAEHVMLVDLGRNDVGRVSRIGSVELSDVMSVERYSHVMHLTSNVTGTLEINRTAFDALRSCLPAGTVSGAPKVRAMEIIDELEPQKRGPYAGAVGYIDFAGSMDTCIALRTIVVTGGKAYVQAGAGVVADSIPELEYEETLNKAKGMLVSIELTAKRLASID